MLVFPEGERSENGKILPGQPGIGLIVAKSGARVQPVRISGAREALPRGSGRIKFARITVTIGPVIDFAADDTKSKDAYQKIADRIMSEISAL